MIEWLIGIFLIIVAVGIIFYIISVYNGLIQLKNNIHKARSNIEVLLKQRSDELPKLISTVKGYMKYEKGVLTEVTKARTSMMNAKTLSQKAAADNMLSGALKTLFAVAENYPKLRADKSFVQLQSRISGLENEIADRREFYNDSVNNFNIRIQSFPDMIVAKWMKFNKPEEMFKASAQDMRDVEIKF
ncbi:MAG: LemA family protein [Candidatus Nanoarchaeia archaeon]|nr:LemA family protein [Candidatus Nanoarchaeia archaeon]